MHTQETTTATDGHSAPARTVHKLLVLLILAGAVAYSNALTNPFVLDDIFWISNNDLIKDLAGYLQAMSTRTVVAFTFYVNYRLHGPNVFGFHLTNVAIHLMASLALFGVIRRSLMLPVWSNRFSAAAPWLAFAVALLWTVHPLQTQAVTYIIQRCESLMGLFFLLAFYCLIRGTQSSAAWRWHALSLVCCLLGANCKEVMVTFLPVALCYDRIFIASFREMLRRRWWYYLCIAGYWAVMLGGAAGALAGSTEGGSAGFGLQHMSPHIYMMTQAGIVLHYIRLVFVPYPQSFSYRGWEITREFSDFWPAGLAMGLLALTTAWLMFRRHWLGFLGAWFFGILSITSIVPLIDVGFEHRMYLPIAAFCALTVFSAYWLLTKWATATRANAVGVFLLALVATTLIGLTMRRNEDYRNSAVLWATVYHANPKDYEAMNNIAVNLVADGKLDEARTLYEQALREAPMNLLELGYGRLLCRIDRPTEGLIHLNRGLEHTSFTPVYPMRIAVPNYHVGAAHWVLGDSRAAEPYFRKAVEFAPQKDFLVAALACVAIEQDRLDEGRRLYAEAIRLNPHFVPETLRKAEANLTREKHPTNWTRKEGLFYALQAAQATEHKDPAVIAVLAEAYAANQMVAQAIQVTQNALRTMDAADPERRRQLQHALTQYQQRLKNAAEKKDKN